MAIKAFPTADGAGSLATGGRNGFVVFVTNEAEYRAAFQTGGARIIIPRVGGTHALTASLNINGNSNPTWNNFTYLGLLASGEGFCTRDRSLTLQRFNNFIIRGMKSRLGDAVVDNSDALSIASTNGLSQNFIVDRSSFSWSVDEVFSVTNCKDFTLQWNILAEPLNFSVHEKTTTEGTTHGFGQLLGDQNASIHHNFYAFCFDRMPLYQNTLNIPEADTLIDFRNNVVYGWGQRAGYMGARLKVNNVFNYYKKKNSSSGSGFNRFLIFAGNSETTTGRVYPYGNVLEHRPEILADVESQKQGIFGTSTANTTGGLPFVTVNTEFTRSYTYDFEGETSVQAKDRVVAKAGFPIRDVLDQRYIQEFLTGESNSAGIGGGGLIDMPSQSKHIDWSVSNPSRVGYPTLSTTPVILSGSAPHYLPSWFLTKYGINPDLDYISAGGPDTAPQRFIIFKEGVGTWLPNYGGSWTEGTDLIYNVYEVLSFHTTDDIDLIESPTFTLTVNSTTGGTTNISGGEFAPSSNVSLVASPSSGFTFTRWEQYNTGIMLWETIVGASASFTYLMPSADTTIRPIFTAIPPRTLSISSTGNGTTNISTATVIAGTPIALSAIPDSGYRYDKWERLIGGTWTNLNALASFNFIMPDENTSLRASFVLIETPIPPINSDKKLFKKRT